MTGIAQPVLTDKELDEILDWARCFNALHATSASQLELRLREQRKAVACPVVYRDREYE